ncbi:MAG TPA: DUF1269 domain-containing protein [Gemmataceae bacterium]|nr:DUF1269 domain-containing protein [Gemmataceae bacterium]
MSDEPVFIYAAKYATPDDVHADYETLLDQHKEDLAETYDGGIITKDDRGKVHVKKHEKRTREAVGGGVAVGAVVAVLFPPSIIAAEAGAVPGGLIAHIRHGMSRRDMKDLGELLDDGEAGLVVVGKSSVREQLDKDLERAQGSVERGISGLHHKEFEKELKEAEKEGAAA